MDSRDQTEGDKTDAAIGKAQENAPRMQKGDASLLDGAKMAEQYGKVAGRPLTGPERELFAKIYNEVAQSFVDGVGKLGVDGRDRLLGIAGATQYREDLLLATHVRLVAHRRGA